LSQLAGRTIRMHDACVRALPALKLSLFGHG